MTETTIKSSSHAVFALRLHLVLVTKYRRPCMTEAIRECVRVTFEEVLQGWHCRLIEFGGESDHVHVLMEIHPALNLASLVNSLKTASSRRVRGRFPAHLQHYYWKPVFWHRAYYLGSVGAATLETVRQYVAAQGTKEQTRKKPA